MLRRGFTLVELLVVIAIIALLSSIAAVSLQQARMQARSVRRLTDLNAMRQALELYVADNGQYPATNGWRLDCYDANHYDDYIPGVSQFIVNLPHDPLTRCSGDSGDYYYGYISDGTDYKIMAPVVPNRAGGLENCIFGKEKGVEDPRRPCNSNDSAWAAYTPGAIDW